MSQTSHLACSYAILLLHDEGLAVTADNISKLVENAKVKNVEKFMPKLYASNITAELIASTLASGGSSAGASSSATAQAASAPA